VQWSFALQSNCRTKKAGAGDASAVRRSFWIAPCPREQILLGGL